MNFSSLPFVKCNQREKSWSEMECPSLQVIITSMYLIVVQFLLYSEEFLFWTIDLHDVVRK